MEKIKEYIKEEMEKYSKLNLNLSENENNNNSKIDNSQKQLKEEFDFWIENLNRSMYDKKYRQVLSEIESGKQNFESIPSEHWRYKSIQLKAIFHIIQRKLIKYPFEISKENSPKNKSLLFWFNYSFTILEQLILQYRGDINANLNLKSKKILKPIQYIFLGQINLLYLLIQYSYIYNQIPEICAYLSMVDRLINYSGYIVNIHTLPILQKLLLIRVKICLANCDYLSGMRYVKKTIDLCTDQLMYIIDYDLNLENIDEYAKDYRNPYKINKMNKKIIEEIFVNISIAFYLRGVLSELLGNTTKAIDSYKQCKFFSTKFLKKKCYNFTMFFSSLQNNGYLYLAVVDELKELKEEKELKESIQRNYLMKKKYDDKIRYERNYNKFYSAIRTRQDLYKGDLKKFLDSANQKLFKEEQNRYSVLKKFTKANYITSTMKMINNLLSKDFKNVLKRMDKVEVTKPSDEINSLINWTLIRQRQKQILFNSKNKKNLFKKKAQRPNSSSLDLRNKMYKESIGAKTVKSKKANNDNNKSVQNIKKDNIFNKIEPINNIKYQKIVQRPLSSTHINSKRKINYFNQKTKAGNSSISKTRTRANKSELSSLDTFDNEYTNKYYYLLENNNNNSSIVKNSYHINNSSTIFLKGKSIKHQRNKNKSFEKKYASLNNYSYKKINNFKMPMKKNNLKIKLKPKKEFRIDKDNFGKDYLQKKIFLDNYFNEEMKFHVKLLNTKSCELELVREPKDFDSKEIKRDAERNFNQIFEICKSSTNKKDIANYLKNVIRINSKVISNMNNSINMDGNLTTINEKNSKIINNFYGSLDEDKKNDNNDRILDAKEKKKILFNNEEKMKILNMEFEQMNQKENELKKKKKKLLEEVVRKKFVK